MDRRDLLKAFGGLVITTVLTQDVSATPDERLLGLDRDYRLSILARGPRRKGEISIFDNHVRVVPDEDAPKDKISVVDTNGRLFVYIASEEKDYIDVYDFMSGRPIGRYPGIYHCPGTKKSKRAEDMSMNPLNGDIYLLTSEGAIDSLDANQKPKTRFSLPLPATNLCFDPQGTAYSSSTFMITPRKKGINLTSFSYSGKRNVIEYPVDDPILGDDFMIKDMEHDQTEGCLVFSGTSYSNDYRDFIASLDPANGNIKPIALFFKIRHSFRDLKTDGEGNIFVSMYSTLPRDTDETRVLKISRK